MSKIKEIVVVENNKKYVSYEKKNIENYEAGFGETALSFSFLMDSYRKIMGRVLTTIDASVSEKTQNKAVKDIVRGIFSDEIESAGTWAFDQDEIQKFANEQCPENLDELESVDVEEVLGIKTS